MGCSNCFNGCSEIVSDQCVRYTGIDVPVLGIKTGDSLSFVEQALITFLTSTLDGSGIIPIIDPTIICNLVEQYLPTCGDVSVNDVLTALIKAACDLQEQVDAIVADVAVIDAPYAVGCLTGVTSTSGTHAIVQAIITKLCTVETNLAALTINVATNYVALADLDALIVAYLASQSPGTNYSVNMVPFVAYEYYGSLIGFDPVTGVGSGVWVNVYICNGYNGLTPDKRGRVAVGATTGMGGGTLNPAVDPALGNPAYILQGLQGTNNVTLSTSQIPLHTHTATSVVSDPGHSHLVNTLGNPPGFNPGNAIQRGQDGGGGNGYVSLNSTVYGPAIKVTTTGITVGTTVNAAGGGTSHPNFQPGIGCFYIMYIP